MEDVAAVLADRRHTYAPGSAHSVVGGSVIRTRKEGFAYEVAPATASDHHAETAGGVRLYVLPLDGTIHADAFADFATAVNPHLVLRRAERAVPAFGTFVLPSSVDVIECEVPATGDFAIFSVTKPMTVVGGKAEIRIKSGAAAHQTYTSGGRWSAIAIRSSHVTVRRVRVDANGRGHYEVDGDGYKWWEVGPKRKRPANGIKVYCAPDEPNITDVVVEECTIRDALAAVFAVGGLGVSPALDDADFIERTRTRGLVVKPIFRKNNSKLCRGNDYLFSNGVLGGEIYDNYSEDSYYHSVRFYTACLDCHAYRNRVYTDFERIAALYNENDLGYWRTDKASDPRYKISRSGMRIGSGWSAGTSVRDCSLHDNVVRYANNKLLDIFDEKLSSLASFQLERVSYGCKIFDNLSYNAPSFVLRHLILPKDTPDGNVSSAVFRNTSYNSRGPCWAWQGRKIRTWGNRAFTVEAKVPVAIRAYRSWQMHEDCELTKADGSDFSHVVESSGSGNVYFCDNWRVAWSKAFAVRRQGDRFLGSVTPGIDIPLENGWATARDGSIPITNTINIAKGMISIRLSVSAADATDDKVCDLPFELRSSPGRDSAITPMVGQFGETPAVLDDRSPTAFVIGREIYIRRRAAGSIDARLTLTQPLTSDIPAILDSLVKA